MRTCFTGHQRGIEQRYTLRERINNTLDHVRALGDGVLSSSSARLERRTLPGVAAPDACDDAQLPPDVRAITTPTAIAPELLETTRNESTPVGMALPLLST